MIVDWLAREGWIVFNWWLLVTLAGLAVLPLSVRLLAGLPDKGYTLARALGLLLVGFVFWLLASLGFVRNTPGSILLAWLIVLVGSLVTYFRQPESFDWREWWGQNRPVIITAEILFAVSMLAFAIYRAHMPNLTGTEKPMELAFMSAVQRSTVFPPNDPWLSGYAISYYYFGYVQSAMLSMMSGISSTIGFNMTISLLFSLTGLTTFGVVYNLVRSRFDRFKATATRIAVLAGLLGMVFVVLMGNFQLPLIEMPYQTRTATDNYLDFWGQDTRLSAKPTLEAAQVGPENWDFWWWFRASRVVTDTNLDGSRIGIQPIDEFPSFSFLLADVHPHVLALPFAMLALGLALNVVLTGRDPGRDEVILYGLALGGLVFLNTWDGPIYMVVLVGADAVRRLVRNGSGRLLGRDWLALVWLGVRLLALTAIFYLPFFISFRSQASGILPNFLFPTRFQQYFVMFGPFMVMIGLFFALEIWLARDRMNWRLGIMAAFGLLVALVTLMLLLAIGAVIFPAQRALVIGFVDQYGGLEAVLPGLLGRRLSTIVTTLVLLAGIAVVVARLFPRLPTMAEVENVPDDACRVVTWSPGTGFALLLVGAGLVLTLAPEFVYLRDNFGVRINTIFKFYYQAWLLFSVAGAYAVFVIVADVRLAGRAMAARSVMAVLVTVAMSLGLLYPLLGYHNRALIETGRATAIDPAPLTLDGGATLVRADDYQAIMCLGAMIEGDDAVVAEAIGPAYNSGYGRVGALTGIPIVLGWENHEGQWRGPTYGQVVGTRPNDVRELYNDLRWDVVQPIIERYGIDYIFYGNSERDQYGSAGEQKFLDNLAVVCERGNSRFFRVDPASMATQR